MSYFLIVASMLALLGLGAFTLFVLFANPRRDR
jgi:hypothetical protein